MFRVPVKLLEQTITGISKLHFDEQPEEVSHMANDMVKMITHRYLINPTNFRTLITALHFVTMHFTEEQISNNLENAPDEVKRIFAMVNLLSVDSGSDTPDE